MALEINIYWKLAIMFVVLVVAYFVLRYFEMDPFVALWEGLTEVEINMAVLVVTFVISGVLWLIIWKNPFWVNSTAFGTPSKIFLSVAAPIVGYIFGLRAWDK